jgi:hypothetical protein
MASTAAFRGSGKRRQPPKISISSALRWSLSAFICAFGDLSVVHADEKLTAFLELESAIRGSVKQSSDSNR